MWVYPAGMCVACHLVDDNVIIHHIKRFVNTRFLFFSHIFDKLCMYIFWPPLTRIYRVCPLLRQTTQTRNKETQRRKYVSTANAKTAAFTFARSTLFYAYEMSMPLFYDIFLLLFH